MIAIIDYGMGNVGAILNMLRKLEAPAVCTARPEEIAAAAGLILPGVGAFDNGMREIDRRGLRPVLEKAVLDRGVPVLGICLGMQLMTGGSEEGSLPGLGWVKARTRRFRFEANGADARRRIPHMGWNTVRPAPGSALLEGLAGEARFYFVHSYHVDDFEGRALLTTTHYGYDFISAFEQGHVAGTQFHPEKSHRFGLQLLKNFVNRLVSPC